jgi:hypothetical protein
LLGFIFKDLYRELAPTIRRTLRRNFRDHRLNSNRAVRVDEERENRNTRRFVQSTENRLDQLEVHIREFCEASRAMRRRSSFDPSPVNSAVTSQSPWVEVQAPREDARIQLDPRQVHEPAAAEWRQNRNSGSANADEEHNLDRVTPDSSVVNALNLDRPQPRPVANPPPRVLNLERVAPDAEEPPAHYRPMLIQNITRCEASADAEDMSLKLVYASQHGQRLHLFQNGECLEHTRHSAAGQPVLDALEVCHVCQNRFGNPQSSIIDPHDHSLRCVYTGTHGRRIHLFKDGTCLAKVNRDPDGKAILNVIEICHVCRQNYHNIVAASSIPNDPWVGAPSYA